MRNAIDLSGKTFGELTVIQEVLPRSKPRRWLCTCTCGVSTEVIQGNLVKPHGTRSCGCLRVTVAKEKNTTHGGRKDGLYKVFSSMKSRCTNPNMESYYLYGGRGISICPEWDNYANFKEWAESSGYTKGLSIDRIDSNLGYSPDNCRWATAECQNRNRNKQRKTSSSKYIGVSWNIQKGKWIVSVKTTDKRVFLGYFIDETEAAKARDTYIIQNNLKDFVLNFK